MNVSVVGLGYVGCVSTACLLKSKKKIYATDIDIEKVNLINSGKAAVSEPFVDEMIAEGLKEGHLKGLRDLSGCLENSVICIVTVGTPKLVGGGLNLDSVLSVAENIGKAIVDRKEHATFVLRSTVPPGTSKKICKIIEEFSGKILNKDFSFVYNPEFLREGTAVSDYFSPGCVVIGTHDGQSNKDIDELYEGVHGEIFYTDYNTSELTKYLNNSWHAIKVAFANEVGVIAKESDADVAKLMDIFLADKKLNVSEKYLLPGAPYGGSCLPKDLNGLNHLANNIGVSTPLLRSVADSNLCHVRRYVELIKNVATTSRVGLLGLTFKADTDDIRDSPFLEIALMLKKEGFELVVFDPMLKKSFDEGRNVAMLSNVLGHLVDNMVSTKEEFINASDIICCARMSSEFLNDDALQGKVFVNLGTGNLHAGFMETFRLETKL